MPFQPSPALKPSFAGDGELGIAELEMRVEDFGVRGASEPRMKFPDALGRSGIAGGVFFQQVFGLILEMIEVGIRWEAAYRHGELPFMRPRSALAGRK